MQTFLPCRDFAEAARLLDHRRLGKQRAETIQVLRALTVVGYGWRHHPAAAMWAGYEEALVCYGLAVSDAWTALGYADTTAATLLAELKAALGLCGAGDQQTLAASGELPPWIGDDAFHRSHQSSLLRKDPAYYRPLFPDVADDLPYVWPQSDRQRRIPVSAQADQTPM